MVGLVATAKQTAVGDAHGAQGQQQRVVVVAGQDLGKVVTAARDIASREGAQAERLLKGELLRSQFDLETYVAKRQADPNYTFREHLKSFGGAIEI